jgi:uncharacterized membrane protein
MTWIQLIVLLIAILGIILPFFLDIAAKIDKLQNRSYEEIKDIYERICAIEEKRRNK